jgi:hypothetical protein
MDCSDDDDNEWVYPDMLSEEGNGVEKTFFDDECMEYDQYYVDDDLFMKKNKEQYQKN